MASHYLAGKESLKEKNYFVIQLVELVQIVFHLYFLAGQSASQQHIYGFGTQISPQNPAQIPQMVSFIFTKLLHCLNVKKNPTIYGASQFGSMPSTIEPIEAHIAIYIYVNANPFTKTQSSLHYIEKQSMYLLMDKIVDLPILNLFIWTNLFSQVCLLKGIHDQ